MQGQLFSQYFLTRGIQETPPWQALDDATFAAFKSAILAIFQGLDCTATINEAQTEELLIGKTLAALGWGENTLPQVNLSAKGRKDVPDRLLFADSAGKAAALAEPKDDQRYRHGVAILEAKRWLRPLDRGDATSFIKDPDAPSSQMLRYLSRAEVMSDRAIQWGILTNGAIWRLYWQGARSRAEEFFEVDLAAALGLPGAQPDLDHPDGDHVLRLFQLFFGCPAFLPQSWDGAGRGFHAYARDEARLYEEKVAQDLGQRVFDDVFPRLADALARGDLVGEDTARSHEVGFGQFTRRQWNDDYLDEVREAALVMLYRLLFLFYAEDRKLLPVHDERYAPYSVRRIREEVRDKIDRGAGFSSTMCRIWLNLRGAFGLLDKGDDDTGMPAYNGGLFARARSPLLERANVPDKVMAPIIDTLSRRTEDLLKGWINYRDLSVSHLGGIYERLLEYRLIHEVQAIDTYKDKPEINRVVAQPASFARKVSGSYYTHDDLVRLVLRESVGLLTSERVAAFDARIAQWASRTSLTTNEWVRLDGSPEQGQQDALDPATQMLELKICDPAMGSGHFLVTLVDDLADRVLEAMAHASQRVNAQPWATHLTEAGRPWQSPVHQRVAAIRKGIKANAQAHGWAVTDAQLDDRHIVRRMILKKVVFGVDKNPLAVELAKTALWLHTFTVGAPLSFLDHHLKCGDSLHGERLNAVRDNLAGFGMLFQQSDIARLTLAAKSLAQVADLTDSDITEARLSMQLATEAEQQVAPIHALLDFWRALRWLVPGWPVDQLVRLTRLLPPAPGQQINPTLNALAELFDTNRDSVSVLATGHLTGKSAAAQTANELMALARALAQRESFFHWWTTFPTVWNAQGQGGFHAVIGNPPWDRIKLQEVEWFAERDRTIAAQPRADDRKRLIAQLQEKQAPLWHDYQAAAERAKTNARVLGNGKLGSNDYPLLGRGDLNLYSLFVERAQTLIRDDGIVALLTPSGIAADKGAAPFFQSISTTRRLGALFDFENKKIFFPDVHANFKFCMMLFGGPRRKFTQTRCAFFLHSLTELDARIATRQVLELDAGDFALVNPNTGAAPIFRTRRDANITMRLYRRHPVLVRHDAVGKTSKANKTSNPSTEVKVWPVKYLRMFDMTNDSGLFLKADELKKRGWTPESLNRWRNAAGEQALPLYVGRMIWHYDHRAASVEINERNLKVASLSERTCNQAKTNPAHYPEPQYWVPERATPQAERRPWALGFRDITNATNARTMVAAIVPGTAAGNTLPLLLPEPGHEQHYPHAAALLLANFNAFAFDYVTRQKAQTTHLNWYTVEQLPVIAPERFGEPLPAAFTAAMRAARLMNGHHAQPTVADFVIPQVLALSYTAHDLASFARDLGYVDQTGHALPPIPWDDEQRRTRLAGLDALFFWLYGINVQDATYVMNTFPIVREQDERAFGHYRTQQDTLAALALL